VPVHPVRARGSLAEIQVCLSDTADLWLNYHSCRHRILESGSSTPYTLFSLMCTSISKLCFPDYYHWHVRRGRYVLVCSGRVRHPLDSKKLLVWQDVQCSLSFAEIQGSWLHIVYRAQLQGGQDSQDVLSRRSFFAKEPLILGLFYWKWPLKIRHPMTLRHSVPEVWQGERLERRVAPVREGSLTPICGGGLPRFADGMKCLLRMRPMCVYTNIVITDCLCVIYVYICTNCRRCKMSAADETYVCMYIW